MSPNLPLRNLGVAQFHLTSSAIKSDANHKIIPMTVNINSVPTVFCVNVDENAPGDKKKKTKRIQCECCEGAGKHRCRKRRHTIGYLPDDDKHGRQRRMSDEMEDRLRDIERRQSESSNEARLRTFKSVATSAQHSLKFFPAIGTQATEEDVGRVARFERAQASTATDTFSKGCTFQSFRVKIQNALRMSPTTNKEQEKEQSPPPKDGMKSKGVESKQILYKSRERSVEKERKSSLKKFDREARHGGGHSDELKRGRRRVSSESPGNAHVGPCTSNIFTKCKPKNETPRNKRRHHSRENVDEVKRKRRSSDVDGRRERNRGEKPTFANKATDAKSQLKIHPKFGAETIKVEQLWVQRGFERREQKPNRMEFNEDQDEVDANRGRSRRSFKSKATNVKNALKIVGERKNKGVQSKLSKDEMPEEPCTCPGQKCRKHRKHSSRISFGKTTQTYDRNEPLRGGGTQFPSQEIKKEPPPEMPSYTSHDPDMYVRNKKVEHHEHHEHHELSSQTSPTITDRDELDKNKEVTKIFPKDLGDATHNYGQQTEPSNFTTAIEEPTPENDQLSRDIILKDFERINRDMKEDLQDKPEHSTIKDHKRYVKPDSTLEFLREIHHNFKSWRCSASSIEPDHCEEIREAMRKLSEATEKIIRQYEAASGVKNYSPPRMATHPTIDFVPDAHSTQRLSDSTQTILDEYRRTLVTKKFEGFDEEFPRIKQSQVDHIVRETYGSKPGGAKPIEDGRKIIDVENQTRFDDTLFKREAEEPPRWKNVRDSAEILDKREIVKKASHGASSIGTEDELKSYVYEAASQRNQEPSGSAKVDNVRARTKTVFIREDVSTYVDPALMSGQETETKFVVVPYGTQIIGPPKRICPAKRIVLKDDVDHLDRLILFISEFIGTWILVFVGCMGCVTALSGGYISHMQICLTFGLGIMVAVQCVSHISGSHINPAVTAGVALLGHMPLVHVPIYFIGQMLGGIAGYGTLMILTTGKYLEYGYKNVSGVMVKLPGVCSPEINPRVTVLQALGVETVLTFLLVLLVCAILDCRNTDKHDSLSIRVGLAITVLALAGGPYSGANMNPARSFGPALLNGDWDDHWIYWVGPMAGGLLAGLLYRFVFASRRPRKVVQVEGNA